MFELKKNVYRTISASNHTESVSLSNQKCRTQPALINLPLNKYT